MQTATIAKKRGYCPAEAARRSSTQSFLTTKISEFDRKDCLEPMLANILNIAALVAALAAAAAAIFTLMQARSAKATLQTQLFLAFGTRYSDPKMGEALTLLINYYKQHRDDFTDRWWQDFIQNKEEALKIEQARRLISTYFIDIARLYESKQINKRFCYLLLGHFGLDVYYNICRPMWLKLYAHEYTDYAAILKTVRPSYGKQKAFNPH